MPFEPSITSMLRWQTQAFGDALQVEDARSGASFRDLERRSSVIARGLLAQGLGKGSQIGLMLPNGLDWVEAWFAIERIGGVAVLMSTLARPAEIAHMLRHADVAALITTERYLSNNYRELLEAALPGLAAHDGARPLRLTAAPYLRSIWFRGGEVPRWAAGGRETLAALAEDFPADLLTEIESEVAPADAALIIYTSGSTAAPKAVVHTHGSVTRQGWAMAEYSTYGRDDRVFNGAPFFWVGGLCMGLIPANLRGAALILADSPSKDAMLETIRTRGVTHIAGWPAQIPTLQALPGFRPGDLANLRPSTSQQLGVLGLAPHELTGNSLGMSETFGPYTMEKPGVALPQDRAHSFSRTIRDAEIRIVDFTTRQPLPPGEVGEICVRGSQLMAGMYKRERPEVFEPDGFYPTGDSGWLSEDGFLFFRGRRTEMIKTNGANVAPREVELVLAAQPEVLEAVVFGVPDDKVEELVVAAVVLREGAEVDEPTLQKRLRAEISPFKVPKRIVFLAAADVPRTDTDKIQKVKLKSMLAESGKLAASAGRY
jgi:acyl-CoA synthetase (AMP-forming)/AMP-acid ligase II